MDTWVKRFRQPEWAAALVAFLFGVASHLFGLMNILHNHDDIFHYPRGYGAGVTSGRWMLQILGDLDKKIFGNYNLAYWNGVIFLAFLAVSAGFVVSVFKMRSRKLASVAGMILVCFPAVTSTMFYRYTVTFYGLAFLFSVLAVWVVEKYRFGWLYSAVLTACALGIYQAYLPVTAALFVLLMIKQVLTEQVRVWDMIKRGLLYCGAMFLGLAFYYVITELSLKIYGVTLNDYQGISEMGSLSLKDMPGLILLTFKSVLKLVKTDYCQLAQTPVLKLCYLMTYFSIAAMVLLILIRGKKKWSIVVMTLLLGMLLPLAANAIQIMCPDSDIRTLMVFGVAVLHIAPLVLADLLPLQREGGNGYIRQGVLVLVLMTVMNYTYLNQVNYTAQYFTNRQVENYVSYLVTQVRMTEGFDAEKRWAMIGNIDDSFLYSDPWKNVKTYGDHKNSTNLLNSWTRRDWIKHYLGYNINELSKEEVEQLRQTEAVQNMPCWPHADSIQIIDDIVVIKFG